MLSSTGKIAELSADGKTVINPSVSTYAGWNEGPELFKRAPYYYVTWSSNGTERGANGIVNSARSMSLAGPWEPDPTNPVMQNLNNGTDPDHPFEGPQHSELIETQNGEWFVTFHTWESRLRHAGAKHVPRARHLDGRRLVAPQERQAAEPHQRRPEPALHAVRDRAQRRLLVDDARAAMVLPHHAGLVGSELVTFGQPGLPADQDPRRRRQCLPGLQGHASPARRSETFQRGDGGHVRCPERQRKRRG